MIMTMVCEAFLTITKQKNDIYKAVGTDPLDLYQRRRRLARGWGGSFSRFYLVFYNRIGYKLRNGDGAWGLFQFILQNLCTRL